MVNRKPEDRSKIAERDILRVAAMLHDVGRSKREKGHHKATFRLVDRLAEMRLRSYDVRGRRLSGTAKPRKAKPI